MAQQMPLANGLGGQTQHEACRQLCNLPNNMNANVLLQLMTNDCCSQTHSIVVDAKQSAKTKYDQTCNKSKTKRKVIKTGSDSESHSLGRLIACD